MQKNLQKIFASWLLVSALVLVFGTTSSAHVVVKPAEVTTASFQTFTVGVPNEKDIPTTKLKLAIPDGLQYVSPTVKSGWSISVDRDGVGEDDTVKAITWSGGEIGVGLRDEFTFSAKVPSDATDLQWKAYQAYSDGTIVSWDQADEGDNSHEDGNSGPFSVTKVVSGTAEQTSISKAEQTATDAKNSSNRSFYTATAGIVIGLVAIFLATRRKD